MRLPRVFVPCLSVHVFQRGHNRAPIFAADDDYEQFLRLAREATARNGVDVHGFGFMTNHYHLVATPQRESSLPRAIQALAGKYTRYYNKRYGRTGTLWGGRYQTRHIEDERYWLTCLRYVEANPVEAKIVVSPEDYRWTSYRVHALGEPSDWLVPHDLYLRLGATPVERQRAYRAYWVSDAGV